MRGHDALSARSRCSICPVVMRNLGRNTHLNCGEMNFSDNLLTQKTGGQCISCERKIPSKLWKKTIEPRMGFVVEDADGAPVPMHKPERDYKTDDYYVGSTGCTVLLTKDFQIGGNTVRLQSTKNDALAVVGIGEHIVCPICGYTTNADVLALEENHKNSRGYVCGYRSEDKNQTPIRLSHTFKTDVASISFETTTADDYQTMVSVLYAVLEGLSRELDIERTDIKGCLHKNNWEAGSQQLYSIILYDAVAGGAGHVRRIVTEDGEVFSKVLRRAYHVVNDCTCDPSCYSCIRNYYNQKIHDVLNRKAAAEFLKNWLSRCTPIQRLSETDVREEYEAAGTV